MLMTKKLFSCRALLPALLRAAAAAVPPGPPGPVCVVSRRVGSRWRVVRRINRYPAMPAVQDAPR